MTKIPLKLGLISDQVRKISDLVTKQRGFGAGPGLEESLKNFGLDSITMLTLLTEIEKSMEIDIPEEYWTGAAFERLADIAELVTRLKGKNS